MTTDPSPPPTRRFRTFLQLVRLEARLALREPSGIVFGIGLPILLLVIFGSLPALTREIPGTSLTIFDAYVPTLVTMVIIMIGLLSMPVPLVRDRELGWLRRLSTTPAPPAMLLAAQVVLNVILATVGVVVITVGGIVLFGARAPAQPLAFALSAILAMAAVFAVGLIIAAFAPTEKSAGSLASGLTFPLLFFSGLYFPIQLLPAPIRTLSSFTPVGAAVAGMQATMEGSFPSLQTLLVSVAYAAVLGLLAVRYFRWE